MPIVGDVVRDRYRIDAVTGSGGMAIVYRATDLRLDRDVAIKVLAANLAADPSLAARFEREARTMAGFNHPNVVAVYDVEPGDRESGREPLYVMEFCPDGSLADRLAGQPALAVSALVPIIEDVAAGLTELHAAGIVHRDVKPHNILFSGGRAKLGDFGLARNEVLSGGGSLTLAGSMLGTLPYLAPELLAGSAASSASDVYAIGVTAFQCLTGRYPKAQGSLAEAAQVMSSEPAATVSSLVPELGTAYDDTLARALDPDPTARPTPGDFAAALRAVPALPVPASPELPLPSATAAPTVIVAPVVDPSAETVIDAPRVPAPAPARGAERPAPSPAPKASVGGSARGLNPLLVAAIVIALVIGAAIFLGSLGNGSTPGPRPSFATGAVPSASASTAPSVDPGVTRALDRVDAAILAAKGGKDGLSGRDANELEQLASAVRTALDQGDLAAARAAASTLADRARAVTGGLDASRRDPLVSAAADLVAVL